MESGPGWDMGRIPDARNALWGLLTCTWYVQPDGTNYIYNCSNNVRSESVRNEPNGFVFRLLVASYTKGTGAEKQLPDVAMYVGNVATHTLAESSSID